MKVYESEQAVKAMLKRRGWDKFPHRIERYSGDRHYPGGGYIPVMLCSDHDDMVFFRDEEIRTEWVEE